MKRAGGMARLSIASAGGKGGFIFVSQFEVVSTGRARVKSLIFTMSDGTFKIALLVTHRRYQNY